MARIIAVWGPTGLATPTCKLMLRSALTTVAETIALTEHATVKRLYTGTVTASAGDYYHNLLSAGSYVGGGTITVSGTDGTTSYEDFGASAGAVATALTDIHLDHLFAVDYDPASKPGSATALLNELIGNDGGVSQFTANALELAPGESAGTGARTVVLTVQTTGSVAIQGANVRVTLSGSSYIQTTDVNGQVTFNLDDGTWTVSITAAGYSYAGTTIVVNGDEAQTYQMTTNSAAVPSAPNLSVGQLLCTGTDELPESNVSITWRKTVGPGDDGYSLDSAERSETSDINGLIEAEFQIGATYKIRRGAANSPTTREVAFTVPASSPFNLPEHLGNP